MKSVRIFLGLFLSIFCLTSCEKLTDEGYDSPSISTETTYVDGYLESSFRYFYDKDGFLIRIIDLTVSDPINATTNFIYSGNTIISQNNKTQEIFSLNSKGLAESSNLEEDGVYNGGGNSEFNSEGFMTYYTYYDWLDRLTDENTYTIFNGNVARMIQSYTTYSNNTTASTPLPTMMNRLLSVQQLKNASPKVNSESPDVKLKSGSITYRTTYVYHYTNFTNTIGDENKGIFHFGLQNENLVDYYTDDEGNQVSFSYIFDEKDRVLKQSWGKHSYTVYTYTD